MAKKRITVAELHALLQEEFARKSGDVCAACRLPRPTYFAGAREGPNWRLPPLGECSRLCHTLAQDLAARYARRYTVLPP